MLHVKQENLSSGRMSCQVPAFRANWPIVPTEILLIVKYFLWKVIRQVEQQNKDVIAVSGNSAIERKNIEC